MRQAWKSLMSTVLKPEIWFEDIVIAIAIVGVIVGLALIYLPLAFLLPGATLVGWEAWRRQDVGRRK